jgi:Rieske Fe-S protein
LPRRGLHLGAAILLGLALMLILWPEGVDQPGKPAVGPSHLVISAGRIPAPGSILDLAPSPAALARTRAGRLVAVSLNCPYLGCRLLWDEVEKVFRCPCHGDRFDLDGAWRAGPAPSHLHRHPVATVEDGGLKVDFASVFLMIGRDPAPDVQYATSSFELHM